MKNLIIDLDDTLSYTKDRDYASAAPKIEVISRLKYYQSKGFKITIFTSRNMRSFEGNLGKINIYTLPTILDWLNRHNIPFDEVVLGKPWCGFEGFYVDDKAVRPREFVELTYDEIVDLLERDK